MTENAPLEQQVISLAAKNDRLAEALANARLRLQNLQAQLDDVTRPPATFGVFLEGNMAAREADVLVAGRKMRLPVVATLPLGVLKPGQEVRLNDQLVVVAPGTYERVGDVAVVREVLDEDRVLVGVRADDERVSDVAHMKGKPERSASLGLAVEQGGRTEVVIPFRPRPHGAQGDDVGEIERRDGRLPDVGVSVSGE